MVVETFEASYIGDWVFGSLPEKGPLSFHSVFSSTLNLSSAGTIFTLQKPSVFLTPLSIAVKVSENFNFRDFFTPGFNYRIEKKIIYFCPRVSVNIDSAKLWKPLDLTGLDFRQTEPVETLQVLHRKISAKKINTGFAPVLNKVFYLPWMGSQGQKDGFFSMKLSSLLESAYKEWTKGNAAQSAKNLSSLVGLGPGLTPSGDDFLIGFTAFLYGIKKENRYLENFLKVLIGEIKQRIYSTSDISSNFLMLSLEGKVSEPVGCLLLALAEQNFDKLSEYSDRLLSCGHSSGVDTLCGIISGIRFVQINDPSFFATKEAL